MDWRRHCPQYRTSHILTISADCNSWLTAAFASSLCPFSSSLLFTLWAYFQYGNKISVSLISLCESRLHGTLRTHLKLQMKDAGQWTAKRPTVKQLKCERCRVLIDNVLHFDIVNTTCKMFALLLNVWYCLWYILCTGCTRLLFVCLFTNLCI
jgi:Pyruvate/2-oxoacid:ferredoxin oxidoreductase delta subunit